MSIRNILIIMVFIVGGFAYASSNSNSEYQLCLSPPKKLAECQNTIINLINNANQSIWIEGGRLFDYTFIQPLINAQKRGVTIVKITRRPTLDKKYINKKDFFLTGQSSLEQINSFTPHSNIVIVDNNKVAFSAFSAFSKFQKLTPAHVIVFDNANLAQQLQKNWQPFKKSLTLNMLTKLQKNGYKQVVIPRSPNGNYYIYGKINNIEVRFLIDTGASFSVVPKFVAKHLGLKNGRKVIVNTAAGKRTLYYSKLNSISIGKLALNNVPVLVNPYATSGTILLGMSFLRHLDFYIYQGNLYLSHYR